MIAIRSGGDGCLPYEPFTLHRMLVAELSGRTVSYTYDDLYRLTGETIAGDTAATPQNGTIAYTHDAVGNRTNMTSTVPAVPAGLFFYDANDRLNSDGYDNNGNTTSSGGITATYDFENHLVSKGGVTIVYDGDGNRARKTVAGRTTSYLVDDRNLTGFAQVIFESTTPAPGTSFSPSIQYVYGLDLLSQRRNPSFGVFEVRYFGYDGHGSVRFLADSSGNVTDTYVYDAFGNLISRTGTTPNHYLYAGEQFDEDLNLYYNRARYLDVRTGRFWTMDAFEGRDIEPSSLHRYLFVAGDPVNRRDPSGNFTLVEIAIVSVVIVSLSVTAYLGYRENRDNAIVARAIANAAGLVNEAFLRLTRWSPTDQQDYVKWFGAYTTENYNHVLRGYLVINKGLSENITWHRTSKQVFAYVYVGGPVEIWFGPLFWAARQTGVDSQAGTVVHEVSHEKWNTKDLVYGSTNAKLLAQQYPSDAIKNADNYEYFAERAP